MWPKNNMRRCDGGPKESQAQFEYPKGLGKFMRKFVIKLEIFGG